MRILHVVTLHSSDNAFGGPLRVAVNLCHELRRRGHDASLVAGQRGFPRPPHELESVPADFGRVFQILPGAGFSGLASPETLFHVHRRLRSIDVVHVHLSRDLVTLPAALLALRRKMPLVVQCHGMVDASDRLLARPLDALATRRVLRGATSVLYLTERERDDLVAVAGYPLPRARKFPNGVPTACRQYSRTREKVVLFAARLQHRKRPLDFVRLAAELAPLVPDWRFEMVGPDEGELPAVLDLAARLRLGDRLSYRGALDHDELLAALAHAALYILPSVDEPFPMTVLEALSVGTPVIVTRSCGLARAVEEFGAGAVVDLTVGELVQATKRLLGDPNALAAAALGSRVAARYFGISGVVDRLEEIYSSAVGGSESVTRVVRTVE